MWRGVNDSDGIQSLFISKIRNRSEASTKPMAIVFFDQAQLDKWLSMNSLMRL
jgi:hypothetical protein